MRPVSDREVLLGYVPLRSRSVQVRRACESDAPDVAQLLSEPGYPTDEATALKRLRRLEQRALIAEEDDRVIGPAALAISLTLTHA